MQTIIMFIVRHIQFLISICFALFLCNYTFAYSRITVNSLKDFENTLTIEDCIYVVKGSIDLDGKVLILPKCSKLVFKDGCFVNGVVEGNETTLVPTTANVFKNCIIQGNWKAKCAYSSMFDIDMETMVLFKNLSCLSSHIKLFANRHYYIKDKGNVIRVESISAAQKQKPTLEFHTTDPNVVGLLILGENVELCNLIIKDDYEVENDALLGYNDITNGSTLGVQSESKTVKSLRIEGCDFSGGTSSSYIASSQVLNCQVSKCSFSGYLSDHAVYCSTKIELFEIRDCVINDVRHSAGLFKIRSSPNLQYFSLNHLHAHNLNGYLAVVSLLETPRAKIIFDSIDLTKDGENESVFYGFCVTDETESLTDNGKVNAGQLIVRNCNFNYGYKGAELIYHGSGSRANFDEIRFLNTHTNESNFGGVFSNKLSVSNCTFYNCCTDKGVLIASNSVEIENTTISRDSNYSGGCVLLVNYAHNNAERIRLEKVSFDTDAYYLFKICGGDRILITASKCDFSQLQSSILYVQNGLDVNYRFKRIKLSNMNDLREISFFN